MEGPDGRPIHLLGRHALAPVLEFQGNSEANPLCRVSTGEKNQPLQVGVTDWTVQTGLS